MRPTLWCLHGFLGLSTDWEFLKSSVIAQSHEIQSVDLWSILKKDQPKNLDEWAMAIGSHIDASGRVPSSHDMLLGYSLGGRLALHLRLQVPMRFRRVFVVGPHLGLQTSDEKKTRLKSDQKWAERFQQESWSDVLQAWESQDVFKHSRRLVRIEASFDRTVLAQALDIGSLGRQRSLLDELSERSEFDFIFGGMDTKFTDLALQWAGQLPGMKLSVVPEAGHRVPWDSPGQFIELMDELLQIYASAGTGSKANTKSTARGRIQG
jgi:2-succinyl-6-hydroxy-2,4-cyclohexadiene-1-carboxylate synthase